MSFSGLELSPFFYIVALFILVDALKVYLEIWNRPVRRSFTSDLTKVTALIPTHNGRMVIRETIEDLLRAGLPRHQILVVDDGSTDDTYQILERLGVRFYRIPNMGKVSAINFGIHRVQTPHVLLLDDDTRIGDAKIPTSLLDHFDAAAFNVVPDRRDRHGPKGSGLISCLQRYEYCKSMEIGRRFQDGTASISCVSGAIGLFKKERLQAFHHKHTGVFQGEDLQRTIIELLNEGNVVFVDETVWTVVPDRIGALARQRILYWYPAHYHLFFSYVKLLFGRLSRWRLRYEMIYNVFVVVTDPFRFWSLLMLFYLKQWEALGLIYVLYLLLELYPFFIIQKKIDSGYKYLVLALYPVFGLGNAALRTLSWFVWAYKRFVTGEMRRKSEKDRKWTGPKEA
ncbi:MAG TPA: glycosyltransferase [Candidatus Polarisedimenticolia bacterium]|jgi:glycosyltransferase involved in cell wall biosynthesis|nr:glycosyltransferase [Candidatus Polarisedimenticolia bacterium]